MRSLLFVVVAALAVSCSDAAAKEGAKEEVSAVVPAGALGDVLAGYEALRRALADDDVSGVVATATKLQPSAQTLVTEQKPGAADIAKGLAGLQKLGDAPDVNAARLAFGDLSKGVVAAVSADATLQPGRHLFSCPMARGYQRWVQVTPSMANPYMGKKMLQCGETLTSWKAEG